SDVLWKSFYQVEKHNTTMHGMERVRDLVSPVSLSIRVFHDNVRLFGVFLDGLVAVGGIKGGSHILLLYVLPEASRQGIGDALLRFLEERCTGDFVTLSSSDSALDFYRKRGYLVSGERTTEEGLIATPMKKQKNEKKS
ncbi:MAG: GNAT family N-acetyltransferase, partial [Clostridia bacterium]|nr:GNAT family N-acetyltransferase [Clostridia bacterium]